MCICAEGNGMNGVEFFRQTEIKLNRKASNRATELLRQYANLPTEKIKTDIIEIYKPQIELRAAAAAVASRGKISAIDFAQDLYLKLLELMIDKSDAKGKHLALTVSLALNRVNPSKDTLITLGGKPLEKLTPQEEFLNASYITENKTMLQKAKEIIELVKDTLKPREYEVLSKKLDGKQYYQICEEMDLTHERVRQLYENAVRKLNFPERKNKFSHIFYEDAVPDNYREPLSKISDDMLGIILNNLIENNGYTVGRIFNPNIKGSMLNFIKKSPNFTMKIKLPKVYNNEDFKIRATQLSMKNFGRNLFEFAD
jgi:DNA-binding CsgD family transcriptional regulator